MPSKSRCKCYFECDRDGPLHRFPKPEYPHLEKFNLWKAVLDKDLQEKGDIFIFNQVRFCYRHFEECYRSASHRLTPNAIPTLALSKLPFEQTVEDQCPSGQVETSFNLSRITQDTLVNEPSSSTQHHIDVQNVLQGVEPLKGSAKKGTFRYLKRVITFKEKEIINLKHKVSKLKKKYKMQTNKILSARKMSTSKSFLKVINKMPETIKTFTSLQLKWKNKPRGRRFTLDEKIMALTIYKQSQKAYNLMRKMFVLPSKRSLQKVLSTFEIKPGVNPEIFKNLKATVAKLPAEKKLVNLLFDEVSLSPGVYYNPALKEITGFEDFGDRKSKKLADHALVFMIKGIKSKVKQPICFSFCQGASKKEELKKLIKTIIKEISNTGLIVIATICDQSATNMSAIKSLKEDTKHKYLQRGQDYKTQAFEFEDQKVFPLFDPPHLLKGMRNNFMTKHLKFVQEGKTKHAKWEHLEMLLKLDVGDDEIRLVNKLTETHVNKEKIPKMKVKYAAQVFSQRVSSATRFLAKHNLLPAECEETADLLLIMDKLFDSFNGHSYTDVAKMFKGCLKNNSPHFKLWNELLPIFESMTFKTIKKKRDGTEEVKYEKVPSIQNWIHNMKTFKEMWEFLKLKHKITSLLTRNFNQDPLENFFCNIRSNGIRNINPSCLQFINAFKTLLLNNLNSPHSISANCEKDENQSLQSFKDLLGQKPINEIELTSPDIQIDSLLNTMNQIKWNDSILHAESKKYVAGYIIKKSKCKIFKICETCNSDLLRKEIDLESFNHEIDYTKKSLFNANEDFIRLLNEIYYMIVACLRDSPEVIFLRDKMQFFINCHCDFAMITCAEHKNKLTEYIINLSMNLIIHSWCTGVNRIISGKISNFDKNDYVKLQAFNYYNTHKKRK